MKCKGGVLNYVFVLIMVIAVISTLIWAYFRFISLERIQLNNTHKSINNAFSGIEYMLSLPDELPHQYEEIITPFRNSEDSILVKNIYWGGFNIYSAVSKVGNAISERRVIAGRNLQDFHEIGLYLNDTNIPLSLAGDTKLKGKNYIPEEGLKTAYFNRRGYIHKELLFGPSEETKLSLHELLDTVRLENWYQTLDTITTNMAYQKSNFFQDSLITYFSESEINLKDTLEGYQIIRSKKSIRVRPQAKLNQTILYAPKIFIDNGFVGNLQAYAEDTLQVANDVVLNYPSILCLYSDSRMSFLSLGKSKMIGEIIHFIEEDKIFLTTQLNTVLKPGSKFSGSFLSDGYSLNLGEVKANMMIDRFVKVDTVRNSTYVNFLVDTEINPRADSALFVNSYFFKSRKPKNRILSWVK